MISDEADPLHIVNFSGGKDSTYLLLEMIRRNMPIDLVVTADTGMEFPAMYDHIDKVEQFLLSERGIPITRLKNPQTFEELMFSAVKADVETNATGYGWPGAVVRWCTGQLKTHLIEDFVKSLHQRPCHYIALAADEQYRLKRKGNQQPNKRYPLVEWNVTESQALAGCYQAGYTWDGLYKRFHRVSCWCCPMQSLNELRTLRKYYPDLWAELRRLDDKAIAQYGRDTYYGQFRKKESIRMLEVRFDFEQEWWPTHGRAKTYAFFAALHRRYQECADYIGFRIPDLPYQQKAECLLPYISSGDLQDLHVESIPKSWHTKKKKHNRTRFSHSR